MTLPAQGSIRSLGPKPVSNLSDSSDDTVPPTAAHGYRGRSVCRSHHAQTRQTDHPIPVEAIVNECAIGRSCGKPLHIRSPVVRWAPCKARVLPKQNLSDRSQAYQSFKSPTCGPKTEDIRKTWPATTRKQAASRGGTRISVNLSAPDATRRYSARSGSGKPSVR